MFLSLFYQILSKKEEMNGRKKGEIKDTERVGEGGNGVRGDAGARWVNVMD